MQTRTLPSQLPPPHPIRVAGEGGLITLCSAQGCVASGSRSQVSSAQRKHCLYCSKAWSGEKTNYVGLSVNPNPSLSPSLVSHWGILEEVASPQTPSLALWAPRTLKLLTDPG